VGQSLASIFLHLVFSTKERQPFLREPGLQERTHGYLASILNNADCPALSSFVALFQSELLGSKTRAGAPDFGCLGASSAKVRYAEGVARPAFFTKNAGYPSAAKISGIGPTDVAPSVSLECRWVCSSRFTHRKKRVSGGTGPR